jgi:1-acyl-sn-glycerol-3-phosphate acyltransferase
VGERKDWAIWFVKIVLRVLFLPLFRLETEGVENIPEKGPFVLLPKHQRWEDIPILGLAMPRPLYYVAKYELFASPIIAWFLRSLGGIPLNRQRPMESRQHINSVVDLLRTGEGLVIFPEGTYFRDKMGTGRSGLIKLILARMSPPFIPIGIKYIKGGPKTVVSINIGRPFFADMEEPLNLFVDRMMKEIAGLSGLVA